MAKENERKEAKERKRKQDGGLLINPLGNTARTRVRESGQAQVRDVLNGKRWGEMGMSKATFYRRLEKVVERVRLTH